MNKKVSIIIIGFLFIVGIILVIVLNNSKDEVSKISESYLVIGNDSNWVFKNNKWEKVTYDKINNMKLDVYVANKYYDRLVLKMGSIWNLYKNNNLVSLDDFVALSKELGSIVDVNISKIDYNDLKYINSVLNTKYNMDDLLNEKVVLDLNNDGNLDYIVNVSNLNKDNQNSYNSLIYVSLNGKKEILVNDNIDVKDYWNYPIYNINFLLKSDDAYNLVIHKGYFSMAGVNGNVMYKINNKKCELVMED